MEQSTIESIVRKIIDEMQLPQETAAAVEKELCTKGEVPDISAIDLSEVLCVENPHNKEAYMAMKKTTPARIGLGRCGPRQSTMSLLRFRADHAAAMDAVFNDVSEAFLKEVGLFSVQTTSRDKAEFLSNPDTGKVLDDATRAILKEKCIQQPQVQIVVADGLSSTSIEENVKEMLPALTQGLKSYGYTIGTPFFIHLGRVAAMDYVTETIHPEVTVLLIGERPGLVTGESMSCYITYKGTIGMPEAKRTVVSNIYKNGLSPAEAGAHVASIVKKMIENKVSGLDLKL